MKLSISINLIVKKMLGHALFDSIILMDESVCPTAPGDYTSLSAQLEFRAGQSVGSSACANLEIIDDSAVEENEESLTLSLSPDDPSFTTTTIVLATVIIRENDNDGTSCLFYSINGYCDSFLIVAGSIALSSSNYDGYESEGAVSVCAVIMAEALERNITVQLSSQDSTARSKF